MSSSQSQGLKIELFPVAHVRSERTAHSSSMWAGVRAWIELDASLDAEAFRGLDAFSHVVVVFFMDRVDPGRIERASRHPQNNPGWPKVGIFAQRGKNRPNRLGLTVCRIAKVEGPRLYLDGLDAIDGTPVLDIKPYFTEYGPAGAVVQPPWVAELMRAYWGGRRGG